MKRYIALFALFAIASPGMSSPAEAATGLAVVHTTASCAGKTPRACGGTMVYKTPAASDLVRYKAGAKAGDPGDYETSILTRYDAVPAGGAFEVCMTDIPDPSTSAANGSPCASWIQAIKSVPPVTNTTGIVKLSWSPPTQNTDGSPIDNLAGFYMYQGTSQSNLVKLATTLGAGATSLDLPLPAGTFYFSISAYNTGGVEGGPSDPVSVKVEKPAPVKVPGKPTQFKATVTLTLP